MGSTFTLNGGIEKIGLGEQAGSWGTTTNTNFDIIDRLINGVGDLTLSGTSSTLTTSDGALSNGMFKVLVLGGSPSGTHTITIAPNDADKLYFVKNGTSQSVIFSQGSGANATITAGKGAIIFADGAGSGAAVTDLTALFINSQALDGVTIDNSVIGGSTPAAITGTTVTANGGLKADDITIDGTEIDLSSGDLTLDVAGDIILDADGGNGKISDGGTQIGDFANDSSDFVISSSVNNKDIIFKGTDNSSGITALTLDMSEAGNATFNGTVTTPGLTLGSTAVTATAAELNIMDGVTATTTELNYTDGVSSNIQTQLDNKHSAVGQGLEESSASTVQMKNSWVNNTSSAISSSSTSSFTATTYPTFISARTNSTGNPNWTITIGGSATSHSTADGDSGTFDSIQFLLPVGGTLACSISFSYFAFQIRPS